MRRLVINADDLGLVESVNRGIIESIEHGVVTSTSLMVNMPGWDDAIARLRQLLERGVRPGVGLHFNVVAGSPIGSSASLVGPDGRFRGLLDQVVRAWTGRIDAADVTRELQAQLRKASDALATMGLRVTHIDSHRHAHCLPRFYEAVTHAATEHGIPHVRHPAETMLARQRRSPASAALRLMAARRPAYDAIGFTGVSMMRSLTFEADLLYTIDRLPDGVTELMVHPGYDSEALGAIDGYRSPRERELKALVSPRVRERLEANKVRLGGFGAPD